MALIGAHKRHVVWTAVSVLALSIGLTLSVFNIYRAERFNHALAQRESALPAWGKRANLEFANAYSLQQQGDLEAALTSYTKITEPTSAAQRSAIKFNLANLYLRQAVDFQASGAIELAIPLIELAKENYRELLRVDSEQWDAKYNLERALILLPEPDDQAEEDDDVMPERSPRATTATEATSELP